MPPKRPVVTARLYRPYAVTLGLVAAAVGATIGYAVGARLAYGFRFDWYRHPAAPVFTPGELVVPVALLVGGLAFVLAPLVTYAAYRVWDARLKLGKAPPALPKARTRDTHAAFMTLGVTAGLAVALSLTVFATLFFLGLDLVSRGGFRDVMTVAGGVGGFLAAYYAFAWTGDALGRGRIIARPGENLIGKVSVLSSRHAGPVVAVMLALTLVVGYGATMITTDVDVADVLPRGDPNTAAAQNLTERFKSSFTLQATFMVRVADEDAWAADQERFLPYRGPDTLLDASKGPHNITDEVYIRAADQLVEFVKGYEGSPFVSSVSVPDLYRIINWTIGGGINNPLGHDAFSLPPADDPVFAQQYKLVHEGVWTAIPDSADALISPDYAQTSILVTVAPQETMASREIGDWALKLRDEYVAWAEANPDEAYQVFTGDNAPIFSVDMPIANAHSSALAEHDFRTLLPFIALFIILTLFIAFRAWDSIVVAFAALAAAVTVTFGAMGHLGIPLNTINLTTLPLIMGVGIDYSIHMINEYREMRARGKAQEEAWRYAGGGSALALFVATLTTVSGLLVMVVSPSLLISQLGLLAAIAMTSCFVLAVVFIPALTSLLGGGSSKPVHYTPSVLMPRLARGVSRARWVVLVIVLLVGTAAFASSQTIHTEAFGDPPRNWLPDDPLRQEHERALDGFYAGGGGDVKANILIFEGNIASPQAHRYMDAIEASLKEQDRIIDDTLRTLPFLVRTYLTVKDGVPGAGMFLGFEQLHELLNQEQFDPYPETQEEIEAILNEAHTTPIGPLANLFFDYPENSMAMMLFSADAATFEDAQVVWNNVWAAVDENADLKPDDLQVAFFGNTAINYLFVEEQVPWLGYMAIATNVIVFGIVLVATARPKIALAVASASFLTSLFWLGLLPQVGIGLAITLTIPLIFIFSMGSDYTLHLGLRCIRTGDTEAAFATVGKGVLFSFLTTVGAFVIFTQISNLSVRQTMIATTLAITMVMLVALLLVPLFWPVKPRPPKATGIIPAGGRRGREVRHVPVIRRGGRGEPGVSGDAVPLERS